MRRRLLVSTLAVAVAAVLLLGVPLAYVISRLQVTEATSEVRRDATTLARELQERTNSGLPANATHAPARIARAVSPRGPGSRPAWLNLPSERSFQLGRGLARPARAPSLPARVPARPHSTGQAPLRLFLSSRRLSPTSQAYLPS